MLSEVEAREGWGGYFIEILNSFLIDVKNYAVCSIS
jgi:hypothetical protein